MMYASTCSYFYSLLKGNSVQLSGLVFLLEVIIWCMDVTQILIIRVFSQCKRGWSSGNIFHFLTHVASHIGVQLFLFLPSCNSHFTPPSLQFSLGFFCILQSECKSWDSKYWHSV